MFRVWLEAQENKSLAGELEALRVNLQEIDRLLRKHDIERSQLLTRTEDFLRQRGKGIENFPLFYDPLRWYNTPSFIPLEKWGKKTGTDFPKDILERDGKFLGLVYEIEEKRVQIVIQINQLRTHLSEFIANLINRLNTNPNPELLGFSWIDLKDNHVFEKLEGYFKGSRTSLPAFVFDFEFPTVMDLIRGVSALNDTIRVKLILQSTEEYFRINYHRDDEFRSEPEVSVVRLEDEANLFDEIEGLQLRISQEGRAEPIKIITRILKKYIAGYPDRGTTRMASRQHGGKGYYGGLDYIYPPVKSDGHREIGKFDFFFGIQWEDFDGERFHQVRMRIGKNGRSSSSISYPDLDKKQLEIAIRRNVKFGSLLSI